MARDNATKDAMKQLKEQLRLIDIRIAELYESDVDGVGSYITISSKVNALQIKRQAVSDHLSRITNKNFKKDLPESMGYRIIKTMNNKMYRP